jgi:hypothetical protein
MLLTILLNNNIVMVLHMYKVFYVLLIIAYISLFSNSVYCDDQKKTTNKAHKVTVSEVLDNYYKEFDRDVTFPQNELIILPKHYTIDESLANYYSEFLK